MIFSFSKLRAKSAETTEGDQRNIVHKIKLSSDRISKLNQSIASFGPQTPFFFCNVDFDVCVRVCVCVCVFVYAYVLASVHEMSVNMQNVLCMQKKKKKKKT